MDYQSAPAAKRPAPPQGPFVSSESGAKPGKSPASAVSSPIDAVRSFLERQGYPLEYGTARKLATVGYQTWQGLTYVDDETEPPKTREFDVLAAVRKEPSAESLAEVGLIVECKGMRDPWLILTRLADDEEWVDVEWIPNTAIRIDDAVFRQLAWHIPRRHGFSAVRAVGDRRSADNDPAYAALASVTKAAAGRVGAHPIDVRSLLVPVVVTAGPLFQLGYEPDGREILEPVLWQRLLWQGSSVRTSATLVDVVTEEHLETYGRMMAPALQQIASILEQEPPRTFVTII